MADLAPVALTPSRLWSVTSWVLLRLRRPVSAFPRDRVVRRAPSAHHLYLPSRETTRGLQDLALMWMKGKSRITNPPPPNDTKAPGDPCSCYFLARRLSKASFLGIVSAKGCILGLE